MTTPVPGCICGHAMADHVEGTGDCQEPSGRCQCQYYIELCPQCRHAKPDHSGLNGQCTRVVQKTKEPCGCSQYIVLPEPTPEPAPSSA